MAADSELNGDLDSGAPRSRHLGSLLRSRREETGLTLEQLAEAVGKSSSAISNYESGNRVPAIDVLLKLAGQLRASPRELTIASTLDSLDSPKSGEWDEEVRNLHAALKRELTDDLRSARRLSSATRGPLLTLRDWPHAFNIRTVIVGDRRESPPDTLADLLALTASTCDLTYFSDLGLRGAKIRSDKIVMLADEADLRKKLDHDILIVGSGAANLAARFVNSQACFRFAIDERDRDRALDWEKKLRPIADDGFELTRLVNPDDPVGRERLRDLRNLWSQFAKPGIIDPIDFTGGPRGSKQRARIDHGLVSLCRNPWSETGVAVLAAGRSGPGTATSPKILANPSEFEERPLGGVFKVWIPTEAHWEDRYEKLKFEWETHPYDVEKFKAQLANNDGGLSEWLSPTDVLHLNELFSLLAKRALRP